MERRRTATTKSRLPGADHHCSFEFEAGLQKVTKDYTGSSSHFPIPSNFDIWPFHGLFYGPARAAHSHSLNIIRERSQSQTRDWPRRSQSQPLEQAFGFIQKTHNRHVARASRPLWKCSYQHHGHNHNFERLGISYETWNLVLGFEVETKRVKCNI